MKKLKLHFIGGLILFIIVACDGSSQRYQMQKKSLDSGVIVDSTMFGICFNDAPVIVRQKLAETGYLDAFGNFEYHFLNDKLYEFKWEWDSCFSFHNDSLIDFRLKTNGGYPDINTLHTLSDIFSSKYGQPCVIDNNYYWYKGNLEIGVSFSSGTEFRHDFISIVYKNIDMYFKVYNQKYKSDEYGNSYSIDFWNQNCEPRKKRELEEYQTSVESAGKDI